MLSSLVFLPLVFAILVALIPKEEIAKWVSLIGSLVIFGISSWLWYKFDGSSSNLQFVERYEWIPQLGITYFLGVDGISLLLVVLTGFLMPLIFLSMWNSHAENVKYFLCLLLALESGMMGALLAIDVVFFYVFWEVMLIPMYFLIGIWGGKRKIYATTKFVIYTVVGSLLMLVAAIGLYYAHQKQFGNYSTSLLDLYRVKLDANTQFWMFFAFILAFAIKVPVWPFHTWLPDAHVEAPTAGSVILAGVLLKMGTYGFVRFALPLFPEATLEFAPFLLSLGAIGIIYGALTAWVQEDAKKMVAYSSVSHLGFVVVGMLAAFKTSEGVIQLNVEALTGAMYQMINHGISTGALFFLVGVIYERRHTRMLNDFGGLASVMPGFAVLLIVATMSSVGLPGTGGFVGEFLILMGSFQVVPIISILAASGVLLGAIYMLTLCKKILFGPLENEENKKLKDVSWLECSYLAPLAILAVLMGVAPNLFLSKTNASIQHLAKNLGEYRLVANIDTEGTSSPSSLALKASKNEVLP